MLKFKIINTNKTPTTVTNLRRPTRQQRRLLASATDVAHPNADYIVHHVDVNGWRGISRVPMHFTLSYFRGSISKYEEHLWKYNVGECKTVYADRRAGAEHTVVLNNGDTFTCSSMSDVKQELKRRLA